MPTLTDRQRAFCHNLAQGMSATEAAKRAGYSDSYANRQAVQLLVKPQVATYLDELRAEARSNAVMSLAELQEWWTRLVMQHDFDAEEADPRDALKASEYLAKTHGGFTDKVEQSGAMRIEVVYADDS